MPEPQSKLWSRISLGGMSLGALLLIAGLFWNALARPEQFWSAEQASEFDAARSAAHDLTYNHSRPGTSDGSQEAARLEAMKAARERLAKIEAELAAARDLREGTGRWATRLGLAALILFGVGYLSSRGS